MTAATHTELKGLQTQRDKTAAEIDRLQRDVNHIKQQLQAERNRLNEINASIERLTVREPVVSEHALLRYCERVLGCDLAAARASILHPSVVEKLAVLPSGKFPHPDGFRVVVKNRTVVTVETKEGG